MEATVQSNVRAQVKASTNGMGKQHDVRELLAPQDTVVRRHMGPAAQDVIEMLATISVGSLDELIDATVPAAIRLRRPLQMAEPRAESDVLAELRAIASKNQLYRSY